MWKCLVSWHEWMYSVLLMRPSCKLQWLSDYCLLWHVSMQTSGRLCLWRNFTLYFFTLWSWRVSSEIANVCFFLKAWQMMYFEFIPTGILLEFVGRFRHFYSYLIAFLIVHDPLLILLQFPSNVLLQDRQKKQYMETKLYFILIYLP